MCDRHELPSLIEQDVPGIVSNRNVMHKVRLPFSTKIVTVLAHPSATRHECIEKYYAQMSEPLEPISLEVLHDLNIDTFIWPDKDSAPQILAENWFNNPELKPRFWPAEALSEPREELNIDLYPVLAEPIAADIFKGLLWAILGTMAAIIVASSIAWGFYNVFLLIKASLPIVHMPIWSPR